MTTLKDVAEMAGVSVSTVSYVLNGKKKVRPETLKRIEDAIDTLDYCPNLMASGLKTSLSRTVGIIVSDISSMFYTQLIGHMEAELDKCGYCMILCNSDNDPEREKKCLRRMLSRNIDGLILIGTGNSDLSNFRNIKLPLVCVDRISDEKFFTVKVDHVYGGRIATEHLISKGYRNILFIGNLNYIYSDERYSGYRQAMASAGLKHNMMNLKIDKLDIKTAFAETERLVQNGFRFDAIFGCLDIVALGAMKALQKNGISIPDQVGVMGYDDIPDAVSVYPELTTIAQPLNEMGMLAVQYLMKMIKGEKMPASPGLLKPVLRERGSTMK